MIPSVVIYSNVLTAIVRYVAPILTVILLYRSIKPLIFSHQESEIWGWFYTSDGRKHPITHWETVIGSGKNSDLRLLSPGVKKHHALITRYNDGSWSAISLHHAPIPHVQAGDYPLGDHLAASSASARSRAPV